MRETRTTQSKLSRLSGVHQPSISQFLSRAIDISDGQLDRLPSCMGYRLEIVRRLVVPDLTQPERVGVHHETGRRFCCHTGIGGRDLRQIARSVRG